MRGFKVKRIRPLIGFIVGVMGIIACGAEASLVPAMTGTPAAPATVTPIPEPTPTCTLRPTPTASATPTTFSAKPDKPSPSPTTPATPTPTWTPTPTRSPTASVTPLPPSSTPTETGTPTPVGITPGPTPAAESGTEPAAYRYQPIGPAQPDLSQPCPGCPRAPGYITGRVVDASGAPLAGVRLVCYNDWHRYPVVGSKGGGEYDFSILQAAATWYVVILNEADQPLSPATPVQFDPLEACWYRLDWQRLD